MAGASVAQTDRLDRLFERLKEPELAEWEQVEDEIWVEWSKSGSASADLLLDRGRDALQAGNYPLAIEHLTALVDHAPAFAEGYNARATAFYQAGELGLSVQDIEAAVALNPRHFGALSGLAMIFEGLGMLAEALDVYEAVHTIHPHRPDVEDAIIRLEKDLGDVDL
ncbi:hypothetical protein BV911_08595 [Pseudoruegeria sp. SK021]|nr:hypothetical protein BV911_08595 [Pseudoruegeria sp. SK021]